MTCAILFMQKANIFISKTFHVHVAQSYLSVVVLSTYCLAIGLSVVLFTASGYPASIL
jgi:hypothetical protein